jgi:predicted RNA-binding protein with PIN domain
MTILVVDGYNAVYAIQSLRQELEKSLAEARKSTLRMSEAYAKARSIGSVRVVFDGDDRYRHFDASERHKNAVFSRTGAGDDKVIETIRKYASSGKVIVASNDNYVRNNARAHGAVVLDVRELEHPGKKPRTPGKDKNEKKIDQRTCDAITREYRKILGV